MSIESTLRKVEQEIQEGKLGIARDRLQGLVVAFPDDLSLRSRLGDVYFKLGYPRQAGKWWFLDADPSDEMQDAVGQFVAECRGDEREILRRLKLRRMPDEEFAQQRLRQVIESGRAKGLAIPDLGDIQISRSTEHRAFAWGCGIVVVVAVLLMMVGLMTVVARLFGWE